MKNKTTKIILLVLVLALVLACVAACDKAGNIKIKVMDGETELTTFEITSGTSLTEESVKAKMIKADYDFVGLYTDAEMTEEFSYDTLVTEETTLYAKFSQKTYYIIVKQGEGESKVEKVAVKKNAEYTVAAPEKEGYDFAGYTYLNEEEVEQNFALTGTYNFSADVRLTAHWTKQTFTVTFKKADETEITKQTGIEYGAKASAITVNEYTIDGYYLDKEFTEAKKVIISTYEIKAATTIYVKMTYNPNPYVITYGDKTLNVTHNAPYELPQDLVKYGFTFGGYTYQGNTFPAQGDYTYEQNITVEIVWNPVAAGEDNFVAVENEHYFKERATADDAWTYVFLTGAEYTFGGYDISSEAAGSLLYITGDKINPIAPGAFTLTLTSKNSGAATTISGKVVFDVNSIASGSGYTAMLSNANNSNLFQTTATASENRMLVGMNNFIPEVTVSKQGDMAQLTLEQANVVLAGVPATDYTISGNSITFTNAALLNQNIDLTLKAKYSTSTSTQSTIKISLNDGVNVYTNAELQAAYSDLGVSKINVLRNITASFADDSYVNGTRGTAETLTVTNAGTTNSYTLSVEDNGEILNIYKNGVYRRTTNAEATVDSHDSITINGNYFTIDGTKLPYLDKEKSKKAKEGFGYLLSEPQVGIFLYRSATVFTEYAYDYKWDNKALYVDGTLTMNNLNIMGNYKTEYISATVPGQLNGQTIPHLKMSSSVNGVVVRGGTANLNNTTVTNCSWGLFLEGGVDGYGPGGYPTKDTIGSQRIALKLNLNKSIIKNCWSDDIYSYRLVDLSLTDTLLGYCNGATILMEDGPYASSSAENDAGTLGYSELTSKVMMDKATASAVDNWVIGTEPWFVAYNRVDQAALIKSMAESGYNAAGFTILKHVENEADEVMAMNFMILQVASSGTWESDKDGGVALDTATYNPNAQVSIFFDSSKEGPSAQPDASWFAKVRAPKDNIGTPATGEASLTLYLSVMPKA